MKGRETRRAAVHGVAEPDATERLKNNKRQLGSALGLRSGPFGTPLTPPRTPRERFPEGQSPAWFTCHLSSVERAQVTLQGQVHRMTRHSPSRSSSRALSAGVDHAADTGGAQPRPPGYSCRRRAAEMLKPVTVTRPAEGSGAQDPARGRGASCSAPLRAVCGLRHRH